MKTIFKDTRFSMVVQTLPDADHGETVSVVLVDSNAGKSTIFGALAPHNGEVHQFDCGRLSNMLADDRQLHETNAKQHAALTDISSALGIHPGRVNRQTPADIAEDAKAVIESERRLKSAMTTVWRELGLDEETPADVACEQIRHSRESSEIEAEGDSSRVIDLRLQLEDRDRHVRRLLRQISRMGGEVAVLEARLAMLED